MIRTQDIDHEKVNFASLQGKNGINVDNDVNKLPNMNCNSHLRTESVDLCIKKDLDDIRILYDTKNDCMCLSQIVGDTENVTNY